MFPIIHCLNALLLNTSTPPVNKQGFFRPSCGVVGCVGWEGGGALWGRGGGEGGRGYPAAYLFVLGEQVGDLARVENIVEVLQHGLDHDLRVGEEEGNVLALHAGLDLFKKLFLSWEDTFGRGQRRSQTALQRKTLTSDGLVTE